MADRVGKAGQVLAANIERIRRRRGLTYQELSTALDSLGNPIPVLGLRRIARGERRVDFDDLLALATVLDVYPVDLMCPLLTDTVPYPIGDTEHGSWRVHQWITGHANLDPASPFVGPSGTPDLPELEALLGWLPEDRRWDVVRRWVIESYSPDPEEEQ